MNEQQIRAIVQQEILNHASSARFGLNSIPRHIHDGIDSPQIFQPVLTYVGYVSHDIGNFVLPSGWSVTGGGGSAYVVTHNLNTLLYSAIGIPSADSGSGSDSCSLTGMGANSVGFFVFNTVSGAGSVCDFWFTLTTVANKSITLPTYNVQLL